MDKENNEDSNIHEYVLMLSVLAYIYKHYSLAQRLIIINYKINLHLWKLDTFMLIANLCKFLY